MKPVGLNNPTREEGGERENARPMPGVSFPFCRRQAVRAWVAPTMPVAHVALARSPFLGCRPRSLNGPCRLFPTWFGAEPGHSNWRGCFNWCATVAMRFCGYSMAPNRPCTVRSESRALGESRWSPSGCFASMTYFLRRDRAVH